MSDPAADISPRVSLAGEQAANAASAASQNGAAERAVRSRIALGIRSRRALRMAPPLDDGFRPFRVF